jgi:hypothetical protein
MLTFRLHTLDVGGRGGIQGFGLAGANCRGALRTVGTARSAGSILNAPGTAGQPKAFTTPFSSCCTTIRHLDLQKKKETRT